MFSKIHPLAMKSGKDEDPLKAESPATSASFTLSCINLYHKQYNMNLNTNAWVLLDTVGHSSPVLFLFTRWFKI